MNARVPSLRPVAVFTAIALPVGWVALSIPVATGLPAEPFVLATLVFGLLLPALVLARRDGLRTGRPGAVRRLLRDIPRIPRPEWALVAGLVLIPGAVWLLGAALRAETEPSPATAGAVAVQFVTGLAIVNLAEELVWTGFVQRRLTAAWGLVRGALATALLFAGLHAPLAFAAHTRGAGPIALDLGALLVAGAGLRLLIGVGDLLGRSILLAAVVHASFNAGGLLVDPGSDWIRYVVALVLGVAAAAAAQAVVGGPKRLVRDFVRTDRP
ncbi:CPBP family intramembrane metalloprotease [Agromyces protaetiae]|uniref:CPBP family intramembrane metalloprotease n=1 Tax=Agromyces protaetiae TaxID=2509455 RepID=A0A4P6F9U9_9MICO|nr:type II CAAX endopeptidase family protein [Agromyces protaetiae]QAY72554.1 CPBP family intramembrane metalloprotease [Agromyces protaetiae]